MKHVRYALLAALCLCPAPLAAGLSVGIQAPQFNGPLCDAGGLTGGQFNLSSDCAGKVVFLEFNNPTCGTCISTIGKVEREVYPQFSGNPGVRFVQVAYAYGPYDAADVASMIASSGCTQKTVAAVTSEAYGAYAITTIPYLYMIDRDGVIRYAKKGPVASSELVNELSALAGNTAPPAPPAPPVPPVACMEVSFNASCCRAGETVVLEATVQAVARPFDAYVLLSMPDGSTLSITASGELVPGLSPFVEGVATHPAEASYTLLRARIPPGAPRGTYGATVALTDPGTRNDFCRASATMTLQ